MDLYLRFESEEQAFDVLKDEETKVVLPDGTELTSRKNKFLNVDYVGEISLPTGEFEDADGYQIPKFDKLEGYHVNIRLTPGEDASALDEFLVNPEQPYRVWAGQTDSVVSE